MTAPLPYFPECKKPEYAVRNPRCRKTAAPTKPAAAKSSPKKAEPKKAEQTEKPKDV